VPSLWAVSPVRERRSRSWREAFKRLQATREEIERFGGPRDDRPGRRGPSSNDVEAAADQVEQNLGPIDVWVNNAVATIFASVEETSPEEFLRATQVTYLGTVFGTQAALRRMRPRNRGVIIQVGSALIVPGDSAPGPLLRRQARRPRVHGFPALGAGS
jgi:NAD(P)-dependent dehydrogenase (short-subunit alcohol dehydrogenase family)